MLYKTVINSSPKDFICVAPLTRFIRRKSKGICHATQGTTSVSPDAPWWYTEYFYTITTEVCKGWIQEKGLKIRISRQKVKCICAIQSADRFIENLIK